MANAAAPQAVDLNALRQFELIVSKSHSNITLAKVVHLCREPPESMSVSAASCKVLNIIEIQIQRGFPLSRE